VVGSRPAPPPWWALAAHLVFAWSIHMPRHFGAARGSLIMRLGPPIDSEDTGTQAKRSLLAFSTVAAECAGC
jgi:hypothetical protein